jgi:hypothetical protein
MRNNAGDEACGAHILRLRLKILPVDGEDGVALSYSGRRLAARRQANERSDAGDDVLEDAAGFAMLKGIFDEAGIVIGADSWDALEHPPPPSDPAEYYVQ